MIIILCLYVDAILIFGTNLEAVNKIKKFLSQNFDMKDLGKAELILNTKIIRGDDVITLSQSHYVEKILKMFYYFDCLPLTTPYDPSIHLKKNTGLPTLQKEYA